MARAWETEADDRRETRVGEVTAVRVTVRRIEVSITPIDAEDDVSEYQLVINGRVFSRINPYRARRLGIIED